MNYDPAHKPADVNAEAERIGDLEKPRCYRRFARFWLENEYAEPAVVYAKTTPVPPSKPEDYTYDDLGADPDDNPPDIPVRGWPTSDELFDAILDFDPAEVDPPRPIDFAATAQAQSQRGVMPLNFVVGDPDTQFRRPPVQGMQVHADYTLAGLFEYLRRRFAWIERLRWYIDGETKFRVALMGAFSKEILAGRCDIFFVQFDKKLADWARTQVAAKSRENIKTYMRLHGCSDREAIERMLAEQISAARGLKENGLSNTWIRHPLQTKDQPNKMIQMLTDIGQYGNAPGDADGDLHVARLMSMAGLKATDQFFLQVRYLIKPLSHMTMAASRKSRLWHPHNLFNPGYVQCLLTMFRAYYNYCKVGQDKKTPAMRLGLAEGPVDLAKILGHRWGD